MTVWTFLDNNIITLVGVLSVLLIVIVFLAFKFRPTAIGPVKFSRRKADEIAERFLRSVEKIRELQREVTMIEEVEIIREQMRYTDVVLQDFLRKAKQVHLDLMDKKVNDNNFQRYVEELNTYGLRIEIATDDLRHEFRRSFRENHFAEKPDTEFIIYVQKQIDKMLKIIEDATSHRYTSQILPIKELKAENQNKSMEYMAMLQDVYTEAKKISVSKQDYKMKKMERIKLIVSRYLTREEPNEDIFE
jgi:hypothetical protein